jgi:riboflavin biosynthesis pyrimidine reductase
VVITASHGRLAPCSAQVSYLRTADMAEALAALRAEHGVRAIDCEGGPHLNAALVPAGLVDELHLVISPLLVGGADPLTVLHGGLLDPPAQAELLWLLESGGFLFSRYRLAGR